MQTQKTLTFRYYDLIVALFAAVLLISNLAATKLIAFGPIVGDGGGLLFPVTYIVDDILTEVYGYKYARRAIWAGFGIMLIAVFAFTVVRFAPPAAEYHDQSAYVAVLGFFPRIVAASLCAYLFGSFLNDFVLAKLKVRMQGRKLWVRLLGSTIVGELFDTCIFGLVAFAGILTVKDLGIFIGIGWLFKTSWEILALPVTYRVIAFLKRREGVDAYDTDTNFTPFRIRIDA